MNANRLRLTELLQEHYRGCGWTVECRDDGTLRACGLGGVTWIGLPVVADDMREAAFSERLLELADERMPTGELCPLEILPEAECSADLHALLDELRLADRGHVEVYALAA